MNEIHVVDLKGDSTVLYPYSRYRTSRKGLVEIWCWRQGSDWLQNYGHIPIPIFTDWWPE